MIHSKLIFTSVEDCWYSGNGKQTFSVSPWPGCTCNKLMWRNQLNRYDFICCFWTELFQDFNWLNSTPALSCFFLSTFKFKLWTLNSWFHWFKVKRWHFNYSFGRFRFKLWIDVFFVFFRFPAFYLLCEGKFNSSCLHIYIYALILKVQLS